MKFLFLLKAAAIFSTAQQVVAQTVQFLNTASLAFNDRTDFNYQTLQYNGKNLQFKLSSQPSGPVHLTFAPLDTTRFVVSPCTVTITPENWNVVQQVEVRPLPYAAVLTNGDSKIRVSINRPATDDDGIVNNADGSKCVREQQDLDVTRTAFLKKGCASTGDPHFTSFKGEYYTFHDPGTNTLLDSGETTISAFQYLAQWKNAPGLNGGVAIRHYDSLLILKMKPAAITWDGLSTSAPFDDIFEEVIENDNSNFITYTFDKARRQGQINLADKTVIKFITYRWRASRTWYLNLYIDAPGSYFNRTSGRCGFIDDEPRLSNSAAFSFQRFKYVIPNSDPLDLFNCPSKTESNPLGGCKSAVKTTVDTCAVSVAPVNFCDPVGAGAGTGTTTSTSAASPTSSSSTTTTTTTSASPSPTPAQLADVGCFKVNSVSKYVVGALGDSESLNDYCNRIFITENPNPISCGAGITNELLKAECTDYQFNEIFSLTEAANEARVIYNNARAQCKDAISSLYKSTNADERQHALDLAEDYQFEISENCSEQPDPTDEVVSQDAVTDTVTEEEAAAAAARTAGAAAAGAIVVLGAAIGGIAMMLKRKNGHAAIGSSENGIAQFANPLYGDNVKQHENALYESNIDANSRV